MYTINAKDYRTPNTSSRKNEPIQMLVIHASVGGAVGSLRWLCKPWPLNLNPVSSNYFITKAGEIYQLANDDRATWHAGTSSWRGLNSLQIQRRSIGIELENMTGVKGFVGQDVYPQAQIDALVWLTQQKVTEHRIVPDMVVRHVDIAPARKTDPFGFDWQGYKARAFALADNRPLWRVNRRVSIGAIIRAQPTTRSPQTGKAYMTDQPMRGEIETGELLTLGIFGSGNEWVKTDHGFIWRNLLDKINT